MTLIDVTERAGSPEVRSLLSLLAWTGESGHLDRIVATYANGPRLFAFEKDGRPVGILGVEGNDEGRGVIRHIAVSPTVRRSGVGRAMIDEAMRDLGLRSLVAETDEDAVGFYRSCGFTVRSLGHKYPGVERFFCER